MSNVDALPVPDLELIANLTVELARIESIGPGRGGERRIIPIIGGKATGPRLRGDIMNVGADWQTVFKSGLAELDTRYAMKTHDGAIIEICNYGFRHGPAHVIEAIGRGEEVAPESYYMRTHAKLETGDERYAWVNKTLFVGSGARKKSAVHMALYSIM